MIAVISHATAFFMSSEKSKLSIVRQGCIYSHSLGGDLSVKTPPSMEIFFNLLGFFEKRHSQIFTVHTKKFTKSKIFWLRPWVYP